MENTEINYFEDFIRFLRKEIIEEHKVENLKNDGFKRSGQINMLSHLIELMGENSFNLQFRYCFLDQDDFDNGFALFHKAMRQTDFFSIGEGHLDMIFWYFIYASDEPYNLLKEFINNLK